LAAFSEGAIIMTVTGIFAEVCVEDIERSIAWYTKFFGRPPEDRPMEGLAQWRQGPAGFQVWRDAERAGHSLSTIVVASMGEERSRLDSAGLALEPDQAGGFGIIAQIEDPDGNRLTLAEPPKH
jgi:predicted enzyme related to lactoylglutathione lyase